MPPHPLRTVQLEAYVGKEVIFGVRPADIFDKNLKNPIEAIPGNTVRTAVDVSEPMGDIVTLYLTAGKALARRHHRRRDPGQGRQHAGCRLRPRQDPPLRRPDRAGHLLKMQHVPQNDPIEAVFSSLYGMPCWGVKPGQGSFLTMEFGQPHLEIRDPRETLHTRSVKLKQAYAKRKVILHGEWFLWVLLLLLELLPQR